MNIKLLTRFSLLLLILFSSCTRQQSNQPEEASAMTAIDVQREMEITIGYTLADIEPTMLWQETYAAILRDYAPQFIDEWGNIFGYFLVYDIDMDGVPELIVFEANRDFWMLNAVSVYSFRDGGLITIEATDRLKYILTGIYAPHDNNPGIIVVSIGGDSVSYTRLVIEENRFAISTWAAYGLTGDFLLYYPYTAVIFWLIDGNDVSAEELENVFKRWDEVEDIIHRITEDNIHNIIFGSGTFE